MKTFILLDHRNIESTYFLKREAEKPYLKKSTPAMPQKFWNPMGTIIKNNSDSYTAYTPYILASDESEDKYGRHAGKLSSDSCFNWKLEKENLAHPHWQDINNKELAGKTGPEGFCVFDSSGLPNARGKFTALYLTQMSEKEDGLCLAWSNDGDNWNEYPENPIMPGWHDTFNTITYDHNINKYVMFLRPPFYAGPYNSNRKIARCESDNLIDWSTPRQVLATDELDANAFECFYGSGEDETPRGRVRQVYGLIPSLKYGLYLGFAWIYDVAPGMNWIELIYSIDGVNWIRDESRRPYLKDADAPLTYGPFFGCPIDTNNEHLMYFSKRYLNHHQSIFVKDDRDGIYLYAQKKDRWVGYRAEDQEGELLTCLVTANSKSSLYLNLDIANDGYIEIIPTDSYGETLKIKSTVRIQGPVNKTKMPMQIPEFETNEQKIRFRIKIKNGKLFCLYL